MFFIPVLLATELFEIRRKQPLTIKEFLTLYLIFVGIINLLCLLVVAVVFHHPDYIVDQGSFNVDFTFKYLLLSFSFAIVLSIAYRRVQLETKKTVECLKGGIIRNDTNSVFFNTIIY
jgi:hypothetical protein